METLKITPTWKYLNYANIKILPITQIWKHMKLQQMGKLQIT